MQTAGCKHAKHPHSVIRCLVTYGIMESQPGGIKLGALVLRYYEQSDFSKNH